jgi:hypothetical protein
MGPTQALVDQVLSAGYGGLRRHRCHQSTYLDFVNAASNT